MQIIFHIDLNAFFASAEISVNPSLKGKPVVICRESRRSIITTASYCLLYTSIQSIHDLHQGEIVDIQMVDGIKKAEIK